MATTTEEIKEPKVTNIDQVSDNNSEVGGASSISLMKEKDDKKKSTGFSPYIKKSSDIVVRSSGNSGVNLINNSNMQEFLLCLRDMMTGGGSNQNYF